jgi:hypothetical protein
MEDDVMREEGRSNGTLSKVAATFFTAVIAPILVSVIIQGLGAARVSWTKITPPDQGGGSRDVAIGHGEGFSPVAARQDALRAAVLEVIVPLLERPISEAASRAVCENILANPGSVILRCEDLETQHQSARGTTCYCQEVVVELAHGPLLERLHAACLQTKDG